MRKLFLHSIALLIVATACSQTGFAQQPTPAVGLEPVSPILEVGHGRHGGGYGETVIEGNFEPAVIDESVSYDEGGEECGCDQCGHGKHGNGGRNRDRNDNCNCNGSYKFPVPPLYTYHWPGMYSHRLITNYHSPWRFPALRVYSEETPSDVLGAKTDETIRPAGFEAQRPAAPSNSTKIESVSARLKRHYSID